MNKQVLLGNSVAITALTIDTPGSGLINGGSQKPLPDGAWVQHVFNPTIMIHEKVGGHRLLLGGSSCAAAPHSPFRSRQYCFLTINRLASSGFMFSMGKLLRWFQKFVRSGKFRVDMLAAK